MNVEKVPSTELDETFDGVEGWMRERHPSAVSSMSVGMQSIGRASMTAKEG